MHQSEPFGIFQEAAAAAAADAFVDEADHMMLVDLGDAGVLPEEGPSSGEIASLR